jgi:hypothetical protein
MDYYTWGILKSKGNATAYRSSLKQTVWQLWAAKVRQCCGKTAAHPGSVWRRPSPMAEAKAMISQATVLAYCWKNICWTLSYEMKKLFKIFV